MAEYFTISEKKLEKIAKIIQATATKAEVRAELLADWHNADDHQEWLDEASPQEIADWLVSFSEKE